MKLIKGLYKGLRSLGHGYAGNEKFNTLMNIPKPMTVKSYNQTVSRIKKSC